MGSERWGPSCSPPRAHFLPACRPHQNCWAPHNLVSVGKREEQGREVQGRQPQRGMWASLADAQPGLHDTLLGADAPYTAEQPDSVQLPQGDVAGGEGPLGSVQVLYSLKRGGRTRFISLSITAESSSFWSDREWGQSQFG